MSRVSSPGSALSKGMALGLRTMLEHSSQVLCASDGEGRVVWCNNGFEQALGHSVAEAVGHPMGSLVHPDGPDLLAVALARPGEDVSGVLARVPRKDGTWRWIDWTLRFDPGRKLLFAAGRDVSEWRATHEALRASEAQLRAIVDHSPSAIFVKGMDGRYLLCNDGWGRTVGKPASTVIGSTDVECNPDNASVLAELEAALRGTGSAVVSDLRLDIADGRRDYMVALFLLRDDEGSPYAVCGIATDITDRKRAEESLVARERVLDTVLKASPDIISLMDGAGKIHQISAAEQVILGHRHSDPADGDLFPLVHPDDFDEVASAFIRMVTGSVSKLHLRYRVKHADGHWVTVESRGQAVVDEAGRFMGAVIVSRDISSRLESEERLESVRQAAEQASRAKSDFLSRMSHELRTPLNSILGFSQLLQMDDLAVQQADAVEHILRGGRHLLELIDEVLDIARIESGNLELSIAPVRVSALVREAVDLTRPIADRADVAVRVLIPEDDDMAVLADRRRLLQVLLNLISNAVKYNRSGGRVDISCADAGDGTLRLAVADTGRGIRPENIGRVFEPFDRLGAEQTGVEGTGVGLSLSRHLVEQMGGGLSVDSVLDVGSTFCVALPFSALPAPGANGRGRAHDPFAEPTTFRVLLVEQNLTSLELVERVLSRRPGVAVLAAMHGRLALDLAREHRPGLVLLDLQLPDMPGALLLERLGEDETTADIPVAVLSAEMPPHHLRRLLGRGVAGHVAKPIDVRALLSLVDAVRSSRGT
ncbi:MAG: PAS domain S-box protein [Acidimicrobiales bacterium]